MIKNTVQRLCPVTCGLVEKKEDGGKGEDEKKNEGKKEDEKKTDDKKEEEKTEEDKKEKEEEKNESDSTSDEKFKLAMLARHNKYRKIHDAPDLTVTKSLNSLKNGATNSGTKISSITARVAATERTWARGWEA